MRFCIHMTATLGEDRVLRDVRLLDISPVAGDHQFGLAPDGTWHWPSPDDPAAGESREHDAGSMT